MKKKLVSLIALVLMLAIMLPTVGALAEIRYVKTPNGKSVNVRTQPYVAQETYLASVPYGTALEVEYYYNSTWAVVHLATGSDSAFVQTKFLSSTYPGPYVPTPEEGTTLDSLNFNSFRHVTNYTIQVKTSRSGSLAKLRWAPSKSAALMETLYAGDTLVVLAEGRDWYQVMDEENGYVGFINSAYVVR